MVRGMKILLSLLLTTSCVMGVAQERIESLTPCVYSVLTTIQTKAVYKPLDVKADQGIHIDLGDTNIVLEQEQVVEWLERKSVDSLRGYKLTVNNSVYYLFSSQEEHGSGLIINFTMWLIIDVQSNLFIDFSSLSQNYKLIYFNSETSKLNFIRFTYGDYFFWNRDWDHVDYKMELNEINSGEMKLIESKNPWCSSDN